MSLHPETLWIYPGKDFDMNYSSFTLIVQTVDVRYLSRTIKKLYQVFLKPVLKPQTKCTIIPTLCL